MPPAARLGDNHMCPMPLPPPATGPHGPGVIVGPGCPMVLVGGQPAAVVGDQILCVVPPNVIAMGAPTVQIGGRPAARMGDQSAHMGFIISGCPTVLIGVMSGLGPSVDGMLAKGPKLANKIADLQREGWTIKWGTPGKGTYCNPATQEIVVDPNKLGNDAGIVRSLSHEAGHAAYDREPEIPKGTLTRDEYVRQNTKRDLKDEGEATISNIEARDEILSNGGPDIGISGSQSDKYDEIASKHDLDDPADRDKAREEIGDAFAKGEHPSTDPAKNYEDYYGDHYKKKYDSTP